MISHSETSEIQRIGRISLEIAEVMRGYLPDLSTLKKITKLQMLLEQVTISRAYSSAIRLDINLQSCACHLQHTIHTLCK